MKSVERIGWQDFTGDLYCLSQLLFDKKIDVILAVSLGGFSVAQHLAYNLSKHKSHIPVEVVSVCHYFQGKRLPEPKLLGITRTVFEKENVLIVDDVYETGKTINLVCKIITAKHIDVAVLYNKNKRGAKICYVHNYPKDCWLQLPWEK